jgi:nicotinamide phosphoribosyltransferase
MEDLMSNPILLCDGYKLDHRRQYPAGTEIVYSNWTARGTRREGHDKVVFFGLQYFLAKYLMEEFQYFFYAPVEEVEERYQRRINGYLGPNGIGTEHIRELHALGYIPLRFKALPEGSHVDLRVPMFTVENTDDRFFWMVNYIETLMSSVLWLPSTSATTALHYRRLLQYGARLTGSPEEFVNWQGHDFSFRGMGSPEAAALSGAGHLLFFMGTDTIPAIELIEEYYTPPKDYPIGGSVAATEHSVMCAGGAEEGDELHTYDRLLDLYPNGIVSVVSDTWDLWKVLTETLPELKDKILARDGKLVVRPDSGDPVRIICGDPYSLNPNAKKGVVELLWDTFGGTVTETGHRMLDGHLGVIYGDAITEERARDIIDGLDEKGFASGNVVFGIGSYTYQYVTRDVYGFAMKATWVQINGRGLPIYKDPVTDNGLKKSLRGRLVVIQTEDGFHSVDKLSPTDESRYNDALDTVWENGSFVIYEGFNIIRARALEGMK